MKSFTLCAAALLLLQPALILAFNDADFDDASDLSGDYTRTRRGWSMMRLGRGLQMLRLGKRTAPPPPSHTPQASPEKMRELLEALLEERRHEFRRQPPMPRYGRELDEEALEELYDLLRENHPSKRLTSPYVPASRFQRSANAQNSQDSASYSDQAKHSFSSSP